MKLTFLGKSAWIMSLALASSAILPSAKAAPFTGYITVNDGTHYVSKTFNAYGEYVVTTDLNDALMVSFTPTSAPFSITETNNPASSSHPYFGAFIGANSFGDDLLPNTTTYAFLGGTGYTDPGARATAGGNTYSDISGQTRKIESSIWTLSPTFVLTPTWINYDFSPSASYLSEAEGMLALLGDPVAWSNNYRVPTTPASLAFVCTSPDGCALGGNTVPEPSTAALGLLGFGLLATFGKRFRIKQTTARQ